MRIWRSAVIAAGMILALFVGTGVSQVPKKVLIVADDIDPIAGSAFKWLLEVFIPYCNTKSFHQFIARVHRCPDRACPHHHDSGAGNTEMEFHRCRPREILHDRHDVVRDTFRCTRGIDPDGDGA